MSEIILYIDINENVHNEKLQKMLQSIGLVETLALFSDQTLLLSHISGSKQIDSI